MNPTSAAAPIPVWDETSLGTLCAVAQAAGAAIMAVYARPDFAVQSKADDTPLTEADLAADRVIRARLAETFPGLPVFSEESAAEGDLAAGFFLVDPLDGTKEFVARNGEFTVNIAWVQGGRPRAGVVHAPALGETFWGATGLGAWKAGGQGAQGPLPISAGALHVGAPLRVLASRSHGGPAQHAFLAALPMPHEAVIAGSSLKFCRVAEGAAELYPRLSPTSPWDTAAGQAVLEAAGGVVVDFDGRPLTVPEDVAGTLNPNFIAACDLMLAVAVLGQR